MPLGSRNPNPSLPRYPLVIPPAAPSVAQPLPPDAQTRAAGDTDLWRHESILALEWSFTGAPNPTDPQNGKLFRLDADITRLVVFAQPGVELYISLTDRARQSRGKYDLFHPGGGFMDWSIPTTRSIGITPGDTITPLDPVEVWMLGGVHALRP